MNLAAVFKHVVAVSLGLAGFEIRRIKLSKDEPSSPVPYRENPAGGPVNMSEKLARLETGGDFEWPDMVVLNRAVASLIQPGNRIVELGSGTGRFASEVASDPTVELVCSEFDQGATNWAQRNRPFDNVTYTTSEPSPADGPFDLVVAIDVIEHVDDFSRFLRTCTALAPKAILTTPNKARTLPDRWAGPPEYRLHVREWNAGEFYWVLRSFYPNVELLSLVEPMTAEIVPISVVSRRTPLIGVCRL